MTQGSMDPKLSRWFQDLKPSDIPAGWTPEEIWAASRNELGPERTRELIDLASRDVEVADAWRIAREIAVADAASTPSADSSRFEPRGSYMRTRNVVVAALAAAAVLTLAVWIGRPSLPPIGNPTERGGSAPDSQLPLEAVLARDAFVLDWTDAPKGSRYFLEVADMELNVLHSVRQLKSSDYRVPPESLADLESGATVLWRVEAFLDDGQHLRSETFRVQIAE